MCLLLLMHFHLHANKTNAITHICFLMLVLFSAQVWFYTVGDWCVGLELSEALLGADALGDLQHVEVHGLGQRTALANGGDVSDLDVTVNRCRT